MPEFASRDARPQSHADHTKPHDRLRDFNADRRLLLLAAMALVVGTAGAVAAWALLHLINITTRSAPHQWALTAMPSASARCSFLSSAA
jgi:hypothetical protein